MKYGSGADEDDSEEEETGRRGSQDRACPPLLLGDSTPSYLHSPSFVSVPSHGSFYTEFFPPDLTKFNSDRYRMEGARPLCMTSAWRVISFFIVVFVLPTLLISIPLYARYHVYHAKAYTLIDGDMRSFHSDVSSFWCQGQRIESNGTFEAYLTKEARRAKRRRVSEVSSDLLLTHDDVEEWGIHLIQGSHFTFSTCSRWPGGTLLVVQGEEMMRRCFYKEERLQSELKEEHEATVKKIHRKRSNSNVRAEVDENTGGEVFDDYEIVPQHEIIRQFYSDNSNARSRIDETETDKRFVGKILNSDRVEATKRNSSSRRNPHLSKDELLKVKKHAKGINEKKPLLRFKDVKQKMVGATARKQISKREANPGRSSEFDVTKLESMLVDKGSFFFSMNDTLDVTAGNSSFSSSEEFLQQCSNTIVTIDLSPYPDCRQRTSTSSDNPLRWKFRANETDYYYFIFTSDNSIEANVINFKLLLERRLYDVSDSLDTCSNQSQCIFPFSFMKSAGVIVDFIDRFNNLTSLEDLQNYQLTSICQPRSIVYTVFILLVPFIIVLFAFR